MGELTLLQCRGYVCLCFLNDQKSDGTDIISVDILDYSNAEGVPERDGSEGS